MHPDFKSVDLTVKTAKKMDNYMSEGLIKQHMFDKRTTPWEEQEWGQGVLQEFEINLEKVDRLYYINPDVRMIARMEYKDQQSIYVEFNARCLGLRCHRGAFIFISRDANIFMKLVLAELREDIKNSVYESLREDSIYVEEEDNTRFDTFSRMTWKNVPTLQNLCHEIIYQSRDELRGYSSLLPKLLTESLDNFIRTKEARESYDEYKYIFD